MARHVVADLIFDEHNENEMARHHVVAEISMSHHGLMRMEDLRLEDFDDIDESTIEYHDARPVRGDEVTAKLLIPVTHDEFVALSAIAHGRADDSIIAAARDAIREYVAAHQQQPAAPRRKAS